MSHTTIYFLTEAENIEKAVSKVSSYLDTEHFFDCYDILYDSSGSLANKRKELMNYIKDWDWKKSAEDYLRLAQKNNESGDLRLCGYHLICAGELYSQDLTINTYAYNVDSGDYSIPDDDSGWWVIKVDFHY